MKGIVFMSKLKRKREIKNITGVFKKSQTFFVLILFLIMGIVLGSIFFKTADDRTVKTINSLFLSNLNNKSTGQFLDIFVVSSSFSFVFLTADFFLGLTLWGSIVSPFILFLKGFGIGFSFSYLFVTHGFKGVGFYLLVLLPGTLICTFAMLLLTRESIRFSFSILANIFPKISMIRKKEYSPKLYFLRSGFCFILTTVATTVEVGLFMLLGGVFKF